MKQLIFLILFFSSNILFAIPMGHGGNGGDFLEAYFLGTGQQIMDMLQGSRTGQKFLEDHRLDPKVLRGTLDFRKVDITDDVLLDNRGAEVDAIAHRDHILLQRHKWMNHLLMDHQMEQLIFHEMLRSAGVNDDNYVISGRLNPISQFSSEEAAYKLSNYVNDSFVVVWFEELALVTPGHRTTVMDFRRAIEVKFLNDLPLIYPQEKDFSFQIEIPVDNAAQSQLVITHIEYLFESNLGAGSEIMMERTLSFNQDKASSFNVKTSNWYPEAEVLLQDSPKFVVTKSGSLLFKGRIKLLQKNNSALDFFNLRHIRFYFDIKAKE